MGETILIKQRKFNETQITYEIQLDAIPTHILRIEGPRGLEQIKRQNGDTRLIQKLYKQLNTTGKANKCKLPYEAIDTILSNNGIPKQMTVETTNETKKLPKQMRQSNPSELEDYYYKLVKAENEKASKSIEEIKSRNRHNDWTTISYSYPYEYQ